MSAGGTGAIGPVSVRYAAQIRELLHVQAVQRMAADEEAARARSEAERTARAEAAARDRSLHQPLRARVEAPEATPPATPAKPSEAAEPPAPTPPASTQHIVDIQA